MSIEGFLTQAVILLAASVAVVLVSHRLRLPSVVGLLLTGVLIGPTGLRLVPEMERVELFAEIGVVFLLFGVGLDFSLERLREIRRIFFVGGSAQAVLTIGAATALAVGLGFEVPRAVFFGFLIALSSTAIVLKLYGDRRELNTPQGKLVIGILLFQDFLIVPMIVLTPVLAGAVRASLGVLALRFLASVVVVAGVFLVARHLMPRLLHYLVRTRIREIFVLGALLACLGMALFTESLEFSLALGAFLAGIIVSESEYSHQVVAEMSPFRDVFASIFFISIGMLLDLGLAVERAPAVLGLAASIVALKLLATGAAVALLRYPLRVIAVVALGLAQIGEFSFVLLKVGQRHGLLDRDLYQLFLGAAVLTMLVTPWLVSAAPGLGIRLQALIGRRPDEELAPSAGATLADHVIVVGFGVNGQNLARVLQATGISFLVVELNAETVREARRQGIPVLFGDAMRPEILHSAGIEGARVIVFGISDWLAMRHSVRLARQFGPQVHIVVRTRMVAEIEDLQRCGADEVVAEEFETSIEIFTRVLGCYHVPRNVIRAETRALRGEGYKMLRAPAMATGLPEEILDILAAGTTDLYRLRRDSPVVGKTLRELDFRRRAGASVIAVVRGEQPYPNPAADFELAAGDVLVLVGSHAEIDRAFRLLEGAAAAEEGASGTGA